MTGQGKRDILALCDAAESMRDAANLLWWAHNPEEDCGEGEAPTVDEAQEKHSEAFNALQKAEYYVRKAVENE